MKKRMVLCGLFVLLSCGSTIFAQGARLDSLLHLLPAAGRDTHAVLLYIDVGLQYYTKAADSAALYLQKAQSLSRQLNYPHGFYYASDYYSGVLRRQGRYDSAIAVNSEALDWAVQREDAYQIAVEQANIGNAYVGKGFHETALGYHMQSLAYFEKHNDREEMGQLYGLIQDVYSRMDSPEEAIRFGKKALALLPDTLSRRYGYELLDLSICYAQIRPPQDQKAMEGLQQVLHIAGLRGDAYLEAAAYRTMGNLYFRTNRTDESETYYLKALDFFKEDKYPKDFCIATIGLAKIAMLRNDFKKAEALALQVLALTRRHGIRQEEQNALSFLWELAAARHDYAARNHYKTAVDSVNNLVVNETMLRATEELEIQYETEKKELRITALEGEKRLSMAGTIILLLALAALFFLWRWTVQKRRKAEVQIKQLEQEKQLIATLSVLEGEIQERIRLARDLHDSLGSILAAVKYNLIDNRKTMVMNEEEAKRFDSSINLLDDSIREMRRIAHHLMPESLDSVGLKQSVADFCNSLSIVKFLYFGDDTRLNTKLEMMIYRIMHELVSNALKHSGASHILVEIAQNTEEIFLTVQDDGCGFDPDTQAEGMGLKNINARVAACNGTVSIHSVKGEGTEINVKLRVES